MQIKVLPVEDEILVALPLKITLTQMGFDVVGIASDTDAACEFVTHQPDNALVDINLRAGPTGPDIEAMPASDYGGSVLFVTATPLQLDGVPPGPFGAISKPFNDNDIGTGARLSGQPPSGSRNAAAWRYGVWR